MYRPSLVHTRARAAGLTCTQSPGTVLQAPHFARSLEWLLFTALDSSSGSHAPPPKLAARPVTNTALGQDPGQPPKAAPASSQDAPRSKAAAGPLLQAAADLVRHFPEVCPVPDDASSVAAALPCLGGRAALWLVSCRVNKQAGQESCVILFSCVPWQGSTPELSVCLHSARETCRACSCRPGTVHPPAATC